MQNPKKPKSNKIIFSSAGTNVGSVRKKNEDRISMLLNISQKKTKYNFYGIYDGHAGDECSEYLKNTLHKKFLTKPNIFSNFQNFKKKSKKIFEKTDKDFLEISKTKKYNSGSCALILLQHQKSLYLINTGDSRAILSQKTGKTTKILTQDHKPEKTAEKTRIFQNGGYLYASSTHLIKNDEEKVVKGPIRVFPGRLTISRAFGDIKAKNEDFGGRSGVLIVEPECFEYSVENVDFVVLGSDGLFESLSNEEVVGFVWSVFRRVLGEGGTVSKRVCDFVVEELILFCIGKGSLDNVSVVLVVFEEMGRVFG